MTHKIIKGNSSIMFSAPHCVEQTRNNEIKFAESETLPLIQ
jgi:hypothetical protein